MFFYCPFFLIVYFFTYYLTLIDPLHLSDLFALMGWNYQEVNTNNILYKYVKYWTNFAFEFVFFLYLFYRKNILISQGIFPLENLRSFILQLETCYRTTINANPSPLYTNLLLYWEAVQLQAIVPIHSLVGYRIKKNPDNIRNVNNSK